MVSHTRRSTKGTRSKGRKGRKNYTTKKGSKVFHRKGKYVRKSRKPYSKKKRGGQDQYSGTTGAIHFAQMGTKQQQPADGSTNHTRINILNPE